MSEKEKLRGIDDEFAEAFKKTELYKLYEAHKDELIIGICNNYINLYYNCDSIAKIIYNKKEKSIFCVINRYYLEGKHFKGKEKNDILKPNEIYEEYKSIKENSDIDDNVNAKKKKELKTQSKLFILNNNEKNKSSKWFCIDIENRNKGFKGRFDIIAISKESPHRVALIEVKYGNKALHGHSGIKEHIKNFAKFYEVNENKNYFRDHMRKEIVNIIESLKYLEINTPFDNIPEKNSISPEPEFYFIIFDNNIKDNNRTPKQEIARLLFSDKTRWGGFNSPLKNPIDKGEYGDVTDINNKKFHATFLFSTQKLKEIEINDIIEDISYDKEPK